MDPPDPAACPGSRGPEGTASDTTDSETAGFDTADASVLAPRLAACLHSQEWVDAVLAGRPYGSVPALESAATTAAARLSDDALTEALAAHPRIGERPVSDDEAATHSRREQAGVRTDATTAQRLRAANVAYEQRFGHVFLIRAAGRSVDDVLAAAEQRLRHDPATESRVVREQLGEIAVLRLRTLLDELATERT